MIAAQISIIDATRYFSAALVIATVPFVIFDSLTRACFINRFGLKLETSA
jgi:uncharacterized membrane protein